MNSSRRNGKPASCEPCRKNKTRCDHTFPKCTRCKERGIEEKCYYHPAPLTRPKDGSSLSSGASPVQRKRKRSGAQNGNQGNGPSDGSFPTPITLDDPYDDSVAAVIYRPGYLGPTSYANLLPPDDEQPQVSHRRASFDYGTPNQELSHRHTLTKAMRIQMTTDVLKSLRHIALIHELVVQYCQHNQAGVVPSPILRNGLEAIKATAEQYNLQSTEPDPELVLSVLERTSRPCPILPTVEAKDFHTLFTGPNLRLEFIGHLMATAGRSMLFGLAPSVWTRSDLRGEQMTQFTDEMLRASTTVLVLCTLITPVNDIMVWMCYENLLLTCLICGYPSPPAWQRIGDIATHMYALGVHRESKAGNIPIFLMEVRRRIFCAAYNIDKTIATFLGRPIRLSKRHTDIRLPLDLSDEEVTANQTSFDLACQALDANGWNTSRQYLRSSWIRLRFITSQFREEILDLALTKVDARVEQELASISQRCRASWETLPPHLHYWPSCWDDGLQSSACLMLVVVYLTYLYNEFLIQKLLDKQPLTSNTALLRVSMDLLSTALTLGTIRERTYDVHRDFLYTILLNGIPSGSVLATALQEQQRTGQPFPESISRSEIIRKLSVLTAHLDSATKPGDGNHDLCRKATKAFTRVIDAVLDARPPVVTPSGSVDLGMGEMNLNLDFFTAPGLEGLDRIDGVGAEEAGLFEGVDWSVVGQWTL